MATVERNGNIEIMKFNNPDVVDISIRDASGDEVLLLHDDTKFLFDTLSDWFSSLEE